MDFGIKNIKNDQSVQFYNQYYNIMPTPNYNENTRFLKPDHGLLYLGDKKDKHCRFCDKEEPEVTFKLIAHALPESIGNKALASYYECDDCNQKFGRTIENQYNNYFGLYHVIMNTNGKKLKYKTSAPEGNFNDNKLHGNFRLNNKHLHLFLNKHMITVTQ